MAIDPILVKGMRDYRAEELYQRRYILSIIQSIYALYGFEPLETPALEHRTTLTEKYGEEGEQLLFHILKSGDFLANVNEYGHNYKKIKPLISDKGLRYDLTVPLIRHMATHQHLIALPFRRYQIQPVWRADRPQKGRYREFLQCDADIIGNDSLLCEAEMLRLVYDIFSQLGVENFYIKINHRGVLTAIADAHLHYEKEKKFCMIVDKLEKSGWDYVNSSLAQLGFNRQVIDLLAALVNFKGNNDQLLTQLDHAIGHSYPGAVAVATLRQIITKITHLSIPEGICRIEPGLARGLDYYTGLIMETAVTGSDIGSLGGGGRYDNLGDSFGIPKLSGIGFSIGLDRLYHIMTIQQRFGSIKPYTTEMLITNLEKTKEPQLLQLLNQLRSLGIKTELYPGCTKIQKQLSYAHKKNIPFVLILGEREYTTHSYILKNMQTGIQHHYSWDELPHLLSHIQQQKETIAL